MQDKLDHIANRVDAIYDLLHGDGTENKPGIKIEVDRLKQSAKRQDWWTKTMLGAAITSVAGSAFSILKHHF